MLAAPMAWVLPNTILSSSPLLTVDTDVPACDILADLQLQAAEALPES